MQSHVDHRDRALHNLLSCRDYGGCLLAAQHHGGNLRSVGQIVDSCFHHFHAGHVETVVDLLFKQIVDLIAAVAQCQFVGVGSGLVICIVAGHFAQSSVALDADEVLQCRVAHGCAGGPERGGIEVEHGAVGILDAPDKHHADQYRVAHFVVDLYRLDIHVADSQREFPACHERVGPEETHLAAGAFVSAEKDHHACFVRLLCEVANASCEEEDNADNRCHHFDSFRERVVQKEEEHQCRDYHERDHDHGEAIDQQSAVLIFFVFVHVS